MTRETDLAQKNIGERNILVEKIGGVGVLTDSKSRVKLRNRQVFSSKRLELVK